jgi:hypothetical protein
MLSPRLQSAHSAEAARSPAAHTRPKTANDIPCGLRAAVLRRSEKTRFSSSSDDEVGGFRAQSRRAERAIKHSVHRDQKPMINTRIQAVLAARKHPRRNKPIIR